MQSRRREALSYNEKLRRNSGAHAPPQENSRLTNPSTLSRAPAPGCLNGRLIDRSVPFPTLTPVTQHAVVTMIDAPCSCDCSEHALLGGDSSPAWLFRTHRGRRFGLRLGLCSLQQGLPTAQINSVFQFSSCRLVSSSRWSSDPDGCSRHP
jgi:hypothetical protein